MEIKKAEGIIGDPPRTIIPKKYVTLEFRCKKCRKKFLKRVDEEEYKYVLNKKSFLNSKTCNECKIKQIKKIFKGPNKK